MKKFIYPFFVLLLLPSNFFPQWSTDPNNNLIVGYGLDPHICSDSAGGCYITYDYNSTSYPRWLALERLDKYGYKPWGINKRILGELPGQSKAQIIEDGESGVIISYEDREEATGWTARIRIQRVDSNGNFLWGPTGVKVTLDEINQGSQKIVSDGEGGAVIVWVNTLAEYKVNRISSEGQRMWGDSGIVAGLNGWYDPALLARTTDNKYVVSAERNTIKYFDENGNAFYNNSLDFWLFNIISDGTGGVVLSGKVWNGMIPKLVAQRRDSLGNNLWQEPYVEIADSLYINSPVGIRELNGYYYYYWYGYKNGIELVTQYQVLRPNSTKLFSNGSIAVSNYPVDALLADILPSDTEAVVFIWQDYRPDDGVFGQRKDTLNNKLWNLNDVPIYTGMYSDLYSITDGMGGAIGLGWHQFDFSIRSFKVSKNGILGEVITNIDDQKNLILTDEIVLYQNFPNPFNSYTKIKLQLPEESRIKIELYNVLGENIQTFVDGFYSEGAHTFDFSSGKLTSGIYLYKLQTETKSLTKKLLIIK
ncbi:MAG: T9SS type A sorting domain-containing protein [Ignavibacteriaceae bacterium]|nr:T9SS type A sorting domain-containing protein [Ignavibacteriaceae bacterium]